MADDAVQRISGELKDLDQEIDSQQKLGTAILQRVQDAISELHTMLNPARPETRPERRKANDPLNNRKRRLDDLKSAP